jgi:hypothetical protein
MKRRVLLNASSRMHVSGSRLLRLLLRQRRRMRLLRLKSVTMRSLMHCPRRQQQLKTLSHMDGVWVSVGAMEPLSRGKQRRRRRIMPLTQ